MKTVSLTWNFCKLYENSGLRIDALDKKIDAISGYLASNLTEINNSLELFGSQTNVTEISSYIAQLHKKIDRLEVEDLPFLKQDRIKLDLLKILMNF